MSSFFDLFHLGKAFRKYFEVVPANTDELKDEVYHLRHQVYCEELAFEAPRPDKRETDEYDPHSLHVLLRSVRTGGFMGCTRLVLTRPEDRAYPLPFEKACAATLDRSIVDPARLPRERIAEFGRLAVLAQFRKRQGERQHAAGLVKNFGSMLRPRFPYILAGLYLGTIELAYRNGIDPLFVLTEQRLVLHLRKLGVNIRTIGGPIEHRGQRLPSMMSPAGIIKDLSFLVRPLYRTISTEIAQRS